MSAIRIKYDNNESRMSFPSDFEELENKFFDLFDVNKDINYDFFIKLEDKIDQIKLNDLDKINFEEFMILLKKEENPIISVEKHVETASNFVEVSNSNFFNEEDGDGKSSFLSMVKKESSKKKDNVDSDEDDDKNTFKENKDFIKELLNCEKNITLLLSGEDIDKKNYSAQKTVDLDSKMSFANNKYTDEMSQISFVQIEQINQLEEKFETLKKSIKDNKDQIEKKFKEMEQVYEKENYIQEMKKKHEEELMNERNKFKEFELKFKKEMEEKIDKLINENDILKKKLEKYEEDNKKIMEILIDQNK